ncbi:MAG: hypothetical protein J0I45_16495 [Bosea sp.]|nr:hypothetical protein [Bosea sp. (in: a-proteobacteria)]
MSEIDDGGPAFPHMATDGHRDYRAGLSLRDWFAGQAIGNVIMACRQDTGFGKGETREAYFAATAYRIADAMLAARKHPAS